MKFSRIVLIVGILCFAFGTFWQAVAPWLTLRKIPVKTLEDIAKDIPPEFFMLAQDYPVEFNKYFGKADKKSFMDALETGRDIYIGEVCWQCHSQCVRPVSKEEIRFGKISYISEYNNVMQLPQLISTRRVGPDLIRESGVHSNDWHAAHFKDTRAVTPGSIMPSYTWFFDKDGHLNKKGLSVITYVQWLGSWTKPSKYDLETSKPEAAKIEVSQPEAAKTEVSQPEADKIEASQPEAAKTEVSQSGVGKTKASEAGHE
jgi:cbb3-type cytochrome c oxidase subunit II